jgi:putative endopeptidase
MSGRSRALRAAILGCAVAALALTAAEAKPGQRGLEPLFEAAQTPAEGGAPASLDMPKYGTWGFDASGMDRSVAPGADFYHFVNGAWEAKTVIPDDRTRFGNFDILTILSEARSRDLVEKAAAGEVADPDAKKIGDAYRAFMDEAMAERLDARPLAPELEALRKVATKRDFTAIMGRAPTSGYSSIFGLDIDQDAKAPDSYAVYLTSSGLGLPDRDYYLQPSFADKKAKYQAYVEQMLTMIGWERPAEHAKAIVEFETRLAEASWPRTERRDRDKTYNPTMRAELAALAPGFDWDAFLAAGELPSVDRFIVTTNTAFPKFARIYQETPLDTLKAWQAFRLADGGASLLSKRFVDAHFDFRSKELGGQPEQRARWKRGVGFVEGALGEALGRLYVERYFPPESKAKMDSLVADVRTALKARIEKLDWMGPDTKALALEKLSKFTV